MKYILAVSGGVDSMVLLDMFARLGKYELIVAHFDHGIRDDSHKDAAFVKGAARHYGLSFETKREELGKDASEALARERRYDFLRALSKKHEAPVVTAHHLDDLVETVAINVTRGTGWRGLGAFDSDIIRPFIDKQKAELIDYAEKRNVVWREDKTNKTDAYLRNRLRKKATLLPEDSKRQLRALHAHQKELKKKIHQEVRDVIGDGPTYERHFLIQAPAPVAIECLRVVTNGKLTRPQLERCLHAIKTAKPNTHFEAGNSLTFHFTTRQFSL